jgi:hypothetical protein
VVNNIVWSPSNDQTPYDGNDDDEEGDDCDKSLQFLPYGRSIGSWICLTHKTYTCHTVQNTIRFDIRKCSVISGA